MKISVSLPCGIVEPLTYEAPADPGMEPGARVLVPLGKRAVIGWVMDLDSPYRGRLKRVFGLIDDPFRPGAALMEFARRGAAAYFAPAGSLLDHCLPPGQRNPRRLRLEAGGEMRKLAELAPGELERLAGDDSLRLFFPAPSGAPPLPAPAPPPGNVPSRRLLLAWRRDAEYREECERVLAEGRSVILVVPDNATARYWQSLIPGIDPYHSEVRPAARERTWREYVQGKRGVVCGGISALALPLADPGLLIVDRAASPLLQRVAGSPFRLDHLAELRAASAGIPQLSGAHSHTCASWERRQEPGLRDKRPEPFPPVQVHALKGRERGIPEALLDLVRQGFSAGRKTLVLVNRVQPSLHLFCPSCRRIAACPACGGVLRAEEPQRVSCLRCAFRRDALAGCPRCGRPLEPLHDISIDSLSRSLARIAGEEALRTLTAADLKDPAAMVAAVGERPIVVATLAALNPFFQGHFDTVVWVRPESFFPMEEYNAAEMIHASGSEIAGTLAPGGEMHVFSVFHFHYALQHLSDEPGFFERELKYRHWFRLPPLTSVFELELREPGLRGLAAAMRGLYGKHREDLQVRRAYLVSRRPQRGTYRGVLELHAAPERIAAAGLHRLRRSVLRRTAG